MIFARRGYTCSQVHKAFRTAWHLSRDLLLADRLAVRQLSGRPLPSPPFLFPFTEACDISAALRSSYPGLASEAALKRLFPAPQQAVFTRGLTLGNLLCRASLFRRARRPMGCGFCDVQSCPLHEALQPCTSITSTASGATFPIRQALCCTSHDVIYVVTCVRCGVQGVGETANPSARFPYYIRAASGRTGVNATGAVEGHFRQTPHSPADLRITLVDGIPENKAYPAHLKKALRLRLEHRWIHRLQASLNKRRNWRSSFPGGSQ